MARDARRTCVPRAPASSSRTARRSPRAATGRGSSAYGACSTGAAPAGSVSHRPCVAIRKRLAQRGGRRLTRARSEPPRLAPACRNPPTGRPDRPRWVPAALSLSSGAERVALALPRARESPPGAAACRDPANGRARDLSKAAVRGASTITAAADDLQLSARSFSWLLLRRAKAEELGLARAEADATRGRRRSPACPTVRVPRRPRRRPWFALVASLLSHGRRTCLCAKPGSRPWSLPTGTDQRGLADA